MSDSALLMTLKLGRIASAWLALQVLRGMPPAWEALETADVPNTAFYNCQQAPREARSAAAALCKHWAVALREDPQ